MLAHNLSVVAPELVLAVFAMAALMWGAYSRRRDPSGTILWASVAMLVLAGLFVGFQPEGARTAFDDSFISDGFARFAKVVILFGAAAALAMSGEYLKRTEMLKFEYPVLIVFSVIGMMTMVSAMDLIVLYMGLELQSLSLYVVAAFRRDSLRSTEAGLKYFVLGALSSGLLLYGASLTYGYSGTTAFAGISQAVGEGPLSLGLIFGLVFLAAGIAFKVSAAPFHMWTPDVYEGSPTPVTAFFATAPKAAAAAMFARLLYDAFGGAVSEWQQILAFLSVASMFLGAVAAIGQRNIKRLMAYSSIGHMGYALVGLAAGSEGGVKGVIIYMALYVAMTLGAFTCILAMRRGDAAVEEIDDLAGLSRSNPLMAFVLAMLLFSLAGIPPLAGFFAKWFVFNAAVEAGLYALAVIGVLASVVGAYYYLRVIKIMYFDEPAPAFDRMSGELSTVLGISGVVVVLFSIYPAPLVSMAAEAAKALF